MPDQCLKVRPVPRTKGQPRLKLGHEPLGRRAEAIGRPRFNFRFLEQADVLLSPMSGLELHYGLKSDIVPSPKSATTGLMRCSKLDGGQQVKLVWRITLGSSPDASR